MAMFPDEFPFNRRAAEPVEVAPEPVEVAPEPVVPAAPEPAPSFPIAPTPLPVTQERRRALRHRLTTSASLRLDDQTGPAMKIEMDNLSLLGVRFHSRHPLDIGDKGIIRLEVGPLRWTSRVRVVTCLREDQTNLVGCEFVGNELLRRDARAA